MSKLAPHHDETVLRAVRRTRNLSQVEVAQAAAIHPAYLSRVERGLEVPAARVLARLAAALGHGRAADLLRDPATV